jgi:hypothetical protein
MSEEKPGRDAFVMIDSRGQAVTVVVLESNKELVFTSMESTFQITKNQLAELVNWVVGREWDHEI